METKLKNDMTRIARKEARLLIAPLLKRIATQKEDIVELKRGRTVQAHTSAHRKPRSPSQMSLSEAREWFSSSALVDLRARTGLSAAELGRLVGSSGWSIYRWESGHRPSGDFLVKLASLRKIGNVRARQMLEALKPA